MADELAIIECEPNALAAAIGTAALAGEGNDAHEEMFVTVDRTGIETPASAVDARQASFCTLPASLFEEFRVFDETAALFPVRTVREWLAWAEESERVTVRLLGESGAEMAETLRITTDRREVSIDCTDDPALLAEIDRWLPARFDGTRFLDEAGEPVPTTIRTTATELQQVVAAASRAQERTVVPLSVESGELRVTVEGEHARVTGTMDADIEGPGFEARYGPGLARVARSISGAVTLQTGPEEPLAVVSMESGGTYRYVVSRR